VDFNLPADLVAYLDELDQFIAREIEPLQAADDNIRFFDHRREWRAPISTMAACRAMNGKCCCAG
jgi:hypothetical protein